LKNRNQFAKLKVPICNFEGLIYNFKNPREQFKKHGANLQNVKNYKEIIFIFYVSFEIPKISFGQNTL